MICGHGLDGASNVIALNYFPHKSQINAEAKQDQHAVRMLGRTLRLHNRTGRLSNVSRLYTEGTTRSCPITDHFPRCLNKVKHYSEDMTIMLLSHPLIEHFFSTMFHHPRLQPFKPTIIIQHYPSHDRMQEPYPEHT